MPATYKIHVTTDNGDLPAGFMEPTECEGFVFFALLDDGIASKGYGKFNPMALAQALAGDKDLMLSVKMALALNNLSAKDLEHLDKKISDYVN